MYRVEDVDCLNCDSCEFVTRFDIRSFAAVPLVTRNNLIGVIIVDNPFKNQPLHDEQLQVLQLFANQAGMALENTRLYRTLEEAHAELSDARQRLVHGARLGRMIAEDAPERHYLDTIISESHRLERLLGDVLAFSRKPTICYQPCNLAQVLDECLDDYALTLGEKQIRLIRQIGENALVILGDAGQLKQVCINLLVNAQESMPNGGTIRIGLSSGDEECGRRHGVITIADCGGGIPADLLDKIFTPFYTTKRHGTGLGLAIVNRIVQNHGGSLQVRNIEKGAEFRILLPLSPEACI